MASIVEKFVYSFLMFNFVTASDNTKGDVLDHGAHSGRSALWFGPRLGKRSLHMNNEENSETLRKLIEAADALSYYYRQMPYEIEGSSPVTKAISKKIIFTPKLGRSLEQFPERTGYDSVEFTPRLGRRKTEEELREPIGEDISEDINERTNIFSPRLGRNFKFSPRLGREISDYTYYQPEVRLARSVNKTDSI